MPLLVLRIELVDRHPAKFPFSAHAFPGSKDDQGRVTQRAWYFGSGSEIKAVLSEFSQHGFLVLGMAGDRYKYFQVLPV